LETLLADLEAHAKANPRGDLVPPKPPAPQPRAPLAGTASGGTALATETPFGNFHPLPPAGSRPRVRAN
jgi:hypothetical protein